MIKFICDTENCANAGAEYFFTTDDNVAECGGCKKTLVGQSSDVAPPVPLIPALPKES